MIFCALLLPALVGVVVGLAVGIFVVGRPVVGCDVGVAVGLDVVGLAVGLGEKVSIISDMACFRGGISILTPKLELLSPALLVQAPVVWIPIALPVSACRMGLPESPP